MNENAQRGLSPFDPFPLLGRLLPMLAFVLVLLCGSLTVRAEGKQFVALGADLKPEERAVILQELGLTEEMLADCTVITVTNEEEHAYLDSYLDANVIGTRALSCVLVKEKASGSGLDITTKNISYCTIGMYRNALITAGIADADIIVAGPFPISGTAALIGAVKAYGEMTGEAVPEESLEAATNELVLTGEIARSVGDSDKAEQLIAAVKQEILSGNVTGQEDMAEVLDKVQEELDVELTEEDAQRIQELMEKVGGLELDADALRTQARDIYDKIKNLDISVDQDMKDSIGGFFTKILEKLLEIVDNIRG